MMTINQDKYHSFANYPELENLAKINSNLSISDITISNPNNPAKPVSAKLITFEIL